MAVSLQVFREPVYRIIEPATRWLVRNRVHPNLITSLGCAATLAAAWLFHSDRVRTAGFLVLMGGVADIFDGRVARVSGLASKFGSFYDSTLDRISEIFVFLGLLSLYNRYGAELTDIRMIYVIFLAMGGSLMVSYTRARAEAMGLDCKVGFMQRAERVILLGMGSLVFGLAFNGWVLSGILVLVAIMTNVTAVQRIVWVYRHAAGVPLDDAAPRTSSMEHKT